MKQTFNFSTSGNTFNDDTVEFSFDFDDREMTITEDEEELVTVYLDRNYRELQRLHRCIGALLEEMENE